MVRLTRALAASLVGLATVLPAIRALTTGFPYGTQKIRGVNLGGWLVLEPWITPSLFDNTGNPKIIDEWTFGQYQDRTKALATLKKHWDTWITEDDFKKIAAAGLNHVRLPIGYWAFDTSGGEPYINGQLPYLRKAVGWAQIHNLRVIVDLHGAPGSQNGFDNSGQKKAYPQWHKNQTNIDRTNAIIKRIALMFKDQTSVVSAIAPLNEPAGFDGQDIIDTTKQYWKDSYGNIRNVGNAVEVIHDAFQPLRSWDGFMTDRSKYEGVILDTHVYQMFSVAENQRSHSQHIRSACETGNTIDSMLRKDELWVVVGEWTSAATDCAPYLNGRGVGSRYDGSHPDASHSPVGSCVGLTGKASTFSPSFITFLGKFWEAQAMSFEKSQGWIQWTWKAENADEWTYEAGLDYGWIPQNPTAYRYPDICG